MWLIVPCLLILLVAIHGDVYGQRGRWGADGPPLPSTLKEMTGRGTELIVEVTVESVFPSIEVSGTPTTDAIMDVRRVLKGQSPGQRLTVAQLGGTLNGQTELPPNYSLMKPGERYVLFLRNLGPNAVARGVYPDRGVPRFEIIRYQTIIRIDADLVRLHPGLKFRDQYEGRNSEEVIKEILGYVSVTPAR